ncbi:MAG: tryptophanyl-tRNA synthetase [Bacillota bacterium]|nr:tryptophanyl-tRNA synthetase [Bacillota bacterium]MDK2925799.1 tryptophanyl-tRNA synthetase [Bacillota bacterium]MDK2959928.1 tryptophanyl-tRNA synthetase [Bacillota bacterium]
MKGRVLNGMRPTGRLHLGNYLGSVVNMVELQKDYECYFTIVDWHALTTGYEDTSELQDNILNIAIDWLSAGIDPTQSTIFVQSNVKEHGELHLLLSMITPLSWLERVPTYKEQLKQLEGRNIATYGFLGYPVLMAADILVYKADTVPVGEDQLPHLELAREIARRFNYVFNTNVFPEPQAKLTKFPLLPGIDGRKMSKSYGNEIRMSDSPEEIRTKVAQMVTDPQRIKKTDPGHPEVCVPYQFYKAFSAATHEAVAEECRKAGIGCVACKKRLADLIVERMAPIHERRRQFEAHPDEVRDILREGARRARTVAAETVAEARRAMNLRDL